MLYDENFLRELDESREKITYAKIISLDLEENPIEQVEGRITSGSINIDGNSAVRRTCSLTMVSQDMNLVNYQWGLNTKFKLEIGIQNVVSYKGHYDQYPDIIWFKLGTYVITSINISKATTSFTMSIQGKDKMCLLNGDVGGVINATTDFGTYDFYDTETKITVNRKLTIKQILWDAVHAYANEPFHNIILNDLDELGLELLEYRYDVPMYIIREADSDVYIMTTLDNNFSISSAEDGSSTIGSLTRYDSLTSSMLDTNNDGVRFKIGDIWCRAAKIQYGDTAGYRTCDLVYAGDLIANIGETVTSVFDKIKAMLGEFEYFYDLDGRFIFQRKRSLINTVWTPQHRDGDDNLYVEALALASNYLYNFNGSILISSFQNSPNLANLKNDFTVWGKKKSLSGAEIPIHMRYAIDEKPFRYVMYDKDIALTTLSEAEVEAMEELKTQVTETTNIETLWENFQKTEEVYPSTSLEDEPDWWEILDWAEYYRILFNEYPGIKIPDDYMRTYCDQANKINASKIVQWFSEQYPEAVLLNNPMYNTDTCEVFIYERDGVMSIRFSPHQTCSHTYRWFMDRELFVNQTNWHREGDVVVAGQSFHWKSQDVNETSLQTLETYERARGLIRYYAFCYKPRIPEDRRKSRLAELETHIERKDPWEGKYEYGVDWRELIYRMAKDYRRHNHEDNFERVVAARNHPLYPTGLTGYEQYYTDLEGFWRQLYSFYLTEKEKITDTEYAYTLYRDIEDKTDVNGELCIRGVYKPIGRRVPASAQEKISSVVPIYDLDKNVYTKQGHTISSSQAGTEYYVYSPSIGKYYYKNNMLTYYESSTKGFTFGSPHLGSYYSNQEFFDNCYNEQLYIRDVPAITSIFVRIVEGTHIGMYKFLDLVDYTTGHFFKKVIDNEAVLGYRYTDINSETAQLTLDNKASLYYLSNIEEMENYQEEINALEESILNIRAALDNGLSTYSDINNNIYPATEDLLAEKRVALNNLKTEFANSQFNYIQVSDYFQNLFNSGQYVQMQSFCPLLMEMKNSNPSEDLNFNKFFIYDDSEEIYNFSKCVLQNSLLRSLYKNGNQLNEQIESFITRNNGLRSITSKKVAINFYSEYSDFYEEGPHKHWNKNVYESPQSLIFWFDFLQGDNELRQYSVKTVGDRPKAVNETTVKSIYYRDTPKIIFTTQDQLETERLKTGYNYFILPKNSSYENMFKISAQGIDAKNRIDELLYQHSYCTESVTISAVPIYYLDVNRRIHVYDEESGVNGDYVISKITIPLAYNGMMNITATKAPENSVIEREE